MGGDIHHLELTIRKNGSLNLAVYSNDSDGEDLLIQGTLNEKAQCLLNDALDDTQKSGFFHSSGDIIKRECQECYKSFNVNDMIIEDFDVICKKCDEKIKKEDL